MKKTAAKSLKLGISSHINYASTTLPVLLPSLLAFGVDNIVVVIGGAEAPRTERVDGLEHRYVTHNSFDHTAMIEVVDADLRADWWAFIHDTCVAGADFHALVHDFDHSLEHVYFDPHGWTNMGVFARDFIHEAQDYIVALRNCSKRQAIMSERMFTRMAHSAPYADASVVDQGICSPYGGSQRRAVYYTAVDLIKYQANTMESISKETVLTP